MNTDVGHLRGLIGCIDKSIDNAERIDHARENTEEREKVIKEAERGIALLEKQNLNKDAIAGDLAALKGRVAALKGRVAALKDELSKAAVQKDNKIEGEESSRREEMGVNSTGGRSDSPLKSFTEALGQSQETNMEQSNTVQSRVAALKQQLEGARVDAPSVIEMPKLEPQKKYTRVTVEDVNEADTTQQQPIGLDEVILVEGSEGEGSPAESPPPLPSSEPPPLPASKKPSSLTQAVQERKRAEAEAEAQARAQAAQANNEFLAKAEAAWQSGQHESRQAEAVDYVEKTWGCFTRLSARMNPFSGAYEERKKEQAIQAVIKGIEKANKKYKADESDSVKAHFGTAKDNISGVRESLKQRMSNTADFGSVSEQLTNLIRSMELQVEDDQDANKAKKTGSAKALKGLEKTQKRFETFMKRRGLVADVASNQI